MAQTIKQNNLTWTLSFKAADRYPIVADRIFDTLDEAQAYADNTKAGASAYVGCIISVNNDPMDKNNGVYRIAEIPTAENESKGKLIKVGGNDTLIAADYRVAKNLSTSAPVGQLIKVEHELVIPSDSENPDGIPAGTYKSGFYIVEGPGVISSLSTSTGSSDELGALNTRVSKVETTITEHANSLDTINTAIDETATNIETINTTITNNAIAAKVTLETAKPAETGNVKTYVLKQGDTELGKINIPTDLVVQSGSVKSVTKEEAELVNGDELKPYDNCKTGEKYIQLIITGGTKLNIPAAALVDTYTVAADGYLTMSDSNEIAFNKQKFTSDVLNSYVTTEALNSKNFVDTDTLDTKLNSYVTTDALDTELKDYATAESLNTLIKTVTGNSTAIKNINGKLAGIDDGKTVLNTIVGDAETDTESSKTIEGTRKYAETFANKIESVKVNGVALPIAEDKSVDIAIETTEGIPTGTVESIIAGTYNPESK